MSVMYIQGGTPLEGAWRVQGAKNSVLPVLAGCLLAPQPVVIRNCPRLSDVDAAVDILQHLGASCRWEGEELVVDAGQATGTAIDEGRMRAMRSSIMFLGPLAARMGEATLTYPGGCELGPRPIDLHLEALRAMGCQVEEGDGTITCRGRPRGGVVTLRFPSVGATENAMLCGAGAAEDTTIINAAREPEIVQLQQFLNALGGEVTGAGGSVITVRGGRPLHGGAISILGDRIVAATLLSGVAAAGGEVELQGVDWRHLSTVLQLLEQGGGRVRSAPGRIWFSRRGDVPMKSVGPVATAPYPGFPTDAQAPVMAAFATARGTTIFQETMFSRRFGHVPELRAMGADISLNGQGAWVRGVKRLHGAQVSATDLRGGGALAVAALGAQGETQLRGVEHIDRGYEHLEQMFNSLGAHIRRR